ncbi:phospholipid carrier-dependent glycosyltransferase [Actinomycetospora sp. TBRC 11914]|nr:phospholipid carrier-dependent glycosyltransferase [Actinomycetospora sp. TBRC 11914]
MRGRPDDPRWARPALLGLLVLTAVTYLWDLAGNGWANTFYAAAVQAGTQSWKAWLFGALDAPGTITVDKPPAAMWVMALSGRLFGFSSWSMLVPEALMGVVSVGLVYATVRRWSGPRTALGAAALLAATPIAALMFRYDNPDALLVLVLVLAGYATTRAVEAAGRRAGTWWLVTAGVAVGFGFLTKQLQVMLVVPALGLVHLVVAPTRLRRRILDLVAAVAALVVSAGWYVLLVELWPAADRPYIAGSTDNSLLQLAFGYNGASRILGGSGGSGGSGGGGPRGGAGGAPGAGMPFRGAGGPAGGFGGGGPTNQSPGLTRLFTSGFANNASWLLPAALLLLVAGLWWTRRAPRTDRSRGLLLLGGTWLLVHAVVFSFMSGMIHSYYTVAMAPGLAMTVAGGASILWRHRAELGARVVLALAVAGTGVWSAVVMGQSDWLPVLGWTLAGLAVLGGIALLTPAVVRRPLRALGATVVTVALVGALGATTTATAETALRPGGGTEIALGDAGGHRDGDQASAPPALVALLAQAGTRWSAAAVGAMSAAPLQLASNTPVMSVGGFIGSDPAPTLAQFQADVATGQIRYFVTGGDDHGGGGRSGDGASAQITAWVTSHFTSTTVGGRTVYDLGRPLA